MPRQSQSKKQPKILQNELYRIIVVDRLCSALELADVAGCSEGTMYAYAEGRRDVPYRRVKRLRRYLKDKPRCGDLAECLIEVDEKIAGLTGEEADGEVDDQIASIIESLGEARRLFRHGPEKRAAYYEALRQAELQFDTLKKEGNMMPIRRHAAS